MMDDLTSVFVQALDLNRTWDPQQIASAAATLVRREGGRMSWAYEAGEEWMALTTSTGENYALIWTQAPLAILVPSVTPALRGFLSQNGALTIEAADWEAPIFSIDPGTVRKHNAPNFWPVEPYVVPTMGFSILDLMFATI